MSSSLLRRSSPAQWLGAALGSTWPCRSPSDAKELGREPPANPRQPGWTETLVPGEALGLCCRPLHPEPSCLPLPAGLGSPARHHAAPQPGLQSCREPKPWWAGKPGAAAASPPRCARGPRPSRLPRCSNVLSPSLPPRAPRIGKESQRQLSRHRRVSESPVPGHACSGVCGQGCMCCGVHKKGRVCRGVP